MAADATGLDTRYKKASQSQDRQVHLESIVSKKSIILCTIIQCPQTEIGIPAILPSLPTTKLRKWPARVASRVTNRVAREYLQTWTHPSRYAFPFLCSTQNMLTAFSGPTPPRVVFPEADSRLVARRRRIVNDGDRDRRICLMSRRCQRSKRCMHSLMLSSLSSICCK